MRGPYSNERIERIRKNFALILPGHRLARDDISDPLIFIHRQEVKLPTTWRKAMHVSLFQPTTVQYGDRKVRGMSLICGRCGAVGKVPMNTMAAGLIGDDDKKMDQLAMRKFSNLGWQIGKQATRHRCPACVAATKPFAEALAPLKPKEEAPMPASNGAAPHEVEPPREMSRDDRRVIFAKLQDCYDNERTGYAAQWTDKRVAEDLGVPKAWVAAIREQNFGPDHNAEFTEQLAYAKAVVEDVRALQRELGELKVKHESEMLALNKRLQPMIIVMEKTDRTIAAIEKATVT